MNRDDDEDGYVSRTRVRQEERARLDARKEVIEAILALPPEQVDPLELDRTLHQDLTHLRSMRSSGARQRLVRRLARRTDAHNWAVLEGLIKTAGSEIDREKRREKKLVAWRDRLVTEGDAALGPASTRFPQADRQQLRQLMLRARRNPESGEAAGARRRLLRLLRELDLEGED